jgi:outer membrane lipoprotein SlyB
MARARIAGCLLSVASAAFAQPLDLRVVPVTGGSVQSIREIHASPSPVAPKGSVPQAVGAPSDIEESIPVGAVVGRSFGSGAQSEHKWRFGAAGTPDMQERLAQTGFEVALRMDDGERRVLRVPDASRLRVGQRVTVRSGEVEPLGD